MHCFLVPADSGGRGGYGPEQDVVSNPGPTVPVNTPCDDDDDGTVLRVSEVC